MARAAARLKAPARRAAGKRFPLGLDLGRSAIKWAQVGLIGGAPHLIAVGMRPVQALAALPEPQREQELAEALRQIATQQDLSGPVVLSLPLEDVGLRLLKIPALPEREMAQAIRWQLEQGLPAQVSLAEFTFDSVVLQEIAAEGETRVLVATAPRQRVMGLVERARRAGLQPVAVDIDPFAVAACLLWQRRAAPQETVLVLDLGGASASFSVVTKGQLAFSRSILTTGQLLTQAVSDHLRVGRDEAETLKHTHGLSSETAEPGALVARALASPFENLIVDILHTFKSFSHQMTQSQIQRFDRVWLSGGTAQLPGLAAWLQSRVGVPVELMDPLAACPMIEGVPEDPAWRTSSAQLTVAVGLALREVPVG